MVRVAWSRARSGAAGGGAGCRNCPSERHQGSDGEVWSANLSQQPGVTHYACAFSVTGYSAAGSDLAAEQALTTLHARVVAALSGWTPTTAGLGDVVEQDSDFTLYDAEDSQQPAGEFLARFEMLAIAPTGSPYT